MLTAFIEVEDEIEVVARHLLPIAQGVWLRQRRHLLNEWDLRWRQAERLGGLNCPSGYNGRPQNAKERAKLQADGPAPAKSQAWNQPAMDRYVHFFVQLPLGSLSGPRDDAVA
jgi:hypothetical protein